MRLAQLALPGCLVTHCAGQRGPLEVDEGRMYPGAALCDNGVRPFQGGLDRAPEQLASLARLSGIRKEWLELKRRLSTEPPK